MYNAANRLEFCLGYFNEKSDSEISTLYQDCLDKDPIGDVESMIEELAYYFQNSGGLLP